MKSPTASDRIWLRVLNLARSETKTLLWGLFFLALSSGAGLIYPQMIRKILDQVLAARDYSKLNQAALLIWFAFVIQGIASSVRYYLFTIAGERIVMRLRGQLYGHILDQELSFFDFRRTGDLKSRLSADSTVLQNAVSVNISMGLRNLATAVGGFAMMVNTSPALAMTIFIVVPPIGYGVSKFGKKIRIFSKQSQDALGESANVSEETISGLRTVRSFAQEDYEKHRYNQALGLSFSAAKKRIYEISKFMNLAFFIGFTVVTGVIWFGGRNVVTGHMTPGELMQFLIYLIYVAISVGALGGLWGDLMAAVGAAQRVFEVLDKQPETHLKIGKSFSAISGKVVFQDVHFHYPTRSEVEVLNGVSFELKPGMRMALVGASGSGKSTIASLMARLYDPQAGKIFLDDHFLSELEPNWLRRQIGVVAQEPILISSSIEENILYGNREATPEQVQIAARKANAESFITQFPEGYQTLVGERGIQLSGGQKQRVAIARAILKDPKILILDEATSALDTESESLVQQALELLMEGRTTVVIAHRLATIKTADVILVMQEGKIVESGTHEGLLQNPNGVYRKLIEKQV